MKKPIETIKAVIARVWWLGKGTAVVMGVAVMLALVVGLASTALAAVPGDPFKLGRLNTINALTQLVGSTNNALLRVQNLSSGPDATALELRVEAGRAPLRVSGGAGKATGLDADRVDGKSAGAFFSGKTYKVEDGRVGPGGGTLTFRFAECDGGDPVLGGGGGGSIIDGDDLRSSGPNGTDGWTVFVLDNNNPSGIGVEAICADFPPLRPQVRPG